MCDFDHDCYMDMVCEVELDRAVEEMLIGLEALGVTETDIRYN